jgi:hypothetical protein
MREEGRGALVSMLIKRWLQLGKHNPSTRTPRVNILLSLMGLLHLGVNWIRVQKSTRFENYMTRQGDLLCESHCHCC